jgi:uncharacterized protein YbcV (DUF1398 family)
MLEIEQKKISSNIQYIARAMVRTVTHHDKKVLWSVQGLSVISMILKKKLSGENSFQS